MDKNLIENQRKVFHAIEKSYLFKGENNQFEQDFILNQAIELNFNCQSTIYQGLDRKNNKNVQIKIFPNNIQFFNLDSNVKTIIKEIEDLDIAKYNIPEQILQCQGIYMIKYSNNQLQETKIALIYEQVEKNLQQIYQDKNQIISDQEILDFIEQILIGLHWFYVDRNGMHKDLKPENIYLIKNGNWVIEDFGISRLYKGDQKEQLQHFQEALSNQGSITLWPPELKRFFIGIREEINGQKSDIYSLGIIALILRNKSLLVEELTNFQTGSQHINHEINLIQNLKLQQVLTGMLQIQIQNRINVQQALQYIRHGENQNENNYNLDKKLKSVQIAHKKFVELESDQFVSFSSEEFVSFSIEESEINQNCIIEEENGLYEGQVKNQMPHGYGVKKFVNGDLYDGQWVNGNIEGKGTFIWADGRKYKGQWVEGKIKGIGKYEWDNLQYYEGFWVDGMREGQGLQQYNNKQMYQGQWLNDLREGHGKYYYHDGSIFEGQWKENKKDGKGIYAQANGEICIGTWQEDLLIEQQEIQSDQEDFQQNIQELNQKMKILEHEPIASVAKPHKGEFYQNELVQERRKQELGFEPIYTNIKENSLKLDPYIFENGVIYIGQWFYGKRHGIGEQYWFDGSVYIGQWINDKACGQGILYHENGDVYFGDWIDGKCHGIGEYIHQDGSVYKGEWKENQQSGEGTETWTDGTKYIGNYQNGQRQGQGKFFWSDGSKYIGGFQDNNIHGKGIYFWNDNRRYKGDWKNNKMDGEGTFIWPDGLQYEGQYKNDLKEGFGKIKWPDGKQYQGEWLNGKQHGQGTQTNSKGIERRGEWENGVRTKWID